MFKISENVRRLSDNEKLQYENDGYITGLPVFSDDAQEDLNNLFISTSTSTFILEITGSIFFGDVIVKSGIAGSMVLHETKMRTIIIK